MAHYIRISGRSANERIEAAIPRLLRNSRRVHNRKQATAVAIRMESQGRLNKYIHGQHQPTVPTIGKIAEGLAKLTEGDKDSLMLQMVTLCLQ